MRVWHNFREMSLQSQFHLARGNKHLDDGELEKAKDAFQKAVEADPKSSTSWYNLGLVHKFTQNWVESLSCNQRAAEIDSKNQAAWWNMGIAATALGQWTEARRAWTGFGLKIPAGEGEIIVDYGSTPIRLTGNSTGEVVWCDRIDPARAVIRNVPLADSGHRYKDVLLHDGAPNGYRTSFGRDVPVFDALQLLKASAYATYELSLQISAQADIDSLVAMGAELDIWIEDRRNLRYLCHECSLGNPGEYVIDPVTSTDEPVVMGVASKTEDAVHQLITHWLDARPNCGLLHLERKLPLQ